MLFVVVVVVVVLHYRQSMVDIRYCVWTAGVALTNPVSPSPSTSQNSFTLCFVVVVVVVVLRA